MITGTKIVKQAMNLADIRNTDFLTHEELLDYLRNAMQYVCQSVVNANLDLFTNKAHLVGANGIYKLPFDFWQLKSVKNPYSGQQILRKTDSFPKCSTGYNLVNNTIVLDGFNPGPIEITYYRKPFYISIPNKTLEDIEIGQIVDTSINNILFIENNYLFVWTPKGTTNTVIEVEEGAKYFLVKDEYIIKENKDGVFLLDFNNNIIWQTTNNPDYYFKSEDGRVFFGYRVKDGDSYSVYVYLLDQEITELDDLTEGNTYIYENEEWIEAPIGSFPIGLFDDRPAYTYKGNLYLVNPNKSLIEETLNLPIMKIDGYVKYGIISNGKIYSNIPDTDLNLPNNILYDLIAFRLAVYFLCKMNAESSGVESMYSSMEKQFFQSLDANAGYQRLNNVR